MRQVAKSAAGSEFRVAKSIGGLDDEWLMTDCNGGPQGDVVLFRPFQLNEIDSAVEELRAMADSIR